MARKTVPVGERDIQALPGTFTTSLDPKVILSSLAERTSQILNATRCSVVRVDPVRNPGKAFVFSAIDDPSMEGYSLALEDYPEIQIALEQNLPILVRDEPTDEIAKRIRKLHRKMPFPVSLAIPISYRAESYGVLFLRFSDHGHEISREAIMFCQLIAFGAAVALQNAREYEHLVREAKLQEDLAQQLADANRLRMETLSAASHDIRVPLNSLVGYTDLLLEEAYGPLAPEQREVLGYMTVNSQNLLQIVNTLIDYARIEEGTVPIDVSEGEVSRLLDEIRNTIEPLTLNRPFAVDFQIRGTLPLLETDWVKLKRILMNLLHNAIKFTEEGSVSVTASNSNGQVHFEVADTGLGISPENLPDIFSKWQRVSPTRASDPGGLGLAIVKRYSEMLHARISVASELGKGTRFKVSVPTRWPKSAG
jgi:signal transduction histidine kinase